MTSNDLPAQQHSAVVPGCEGRPQLSDGARDLGDRAVCLVFVAAVAVAGVLGTAWFLAMPAFR